MKDVYIFAIESSCDETSMAIVKNGTEVVALEVMTQIDTHALYGGVVPEIASRMHTEAVTICYEQLMKKANMDIKAVDAVAVTYAPGLLGSLLVGVEFAKTIALVNDLPLIKVNHMAGHIYANQINNKMKYPLLAVVISGGHTNLVKMNGDYEFEVLGSTLDDAIGEAYDKVARIMGIPYPGGPNVEKLASQGTPSYPLPIPVKDDSYNFSFSGLKSAVSNLVNNEKMRGNEINKANLACSFQTVATDLLARKLNLALTNTNIKEVIIAGGVSANKYIRSELNKVCEKHQANLTVPDFIYCTDNAAMIGAAAYPLYLKGDFADYTLNASASDNIF